MTIEKKALKELSNLSFSGQIGSDQEARIDGTTIRRSFRNPDFYTERPGEEDDDWAEFTEEAEALAKAKRGFSADVLEAYHIDVLDEGEKAWFVVELTKK